MLVNKGVKSLEKLITLIEKIAMIIASIILVMMAIMISADTVLRYFFHKPIMGVLELTEGFFMVAIVYLGISATYTAGEHIRVDFLSQYINEKVKVVNEVILNLIAIVFLFIIVVQTWNRVAIAIELNQTTTGAVNLPMAPAYFLVVFGVLLLCVRMSLSTISLILNKKNVKEG